MQAAREAKEHVQKLKAQVAEEEVRRLAISASNDNSSPTPSNDANHVARVLQAARPYRKRFSPAATGYISRAYDRLTKLRVLEILGEALESSDLLNMGASSSRQRVRRL